MPKRKKSKSNPNETRITLRLDREAYRAACAAAAEQNKSLNFIINESVRAIYLPKTEIPVAPPEVSAPMQPEA